MIENTKKLNVINENDILDQAYNNFIFVVSKGDEYEVNIGYSLLFSGFFENSTRIVVVREWTLEEEGG